MREHDSDRRRLNASFASVVLLAAAVFTFSPAAAQVGSEERVAAQRAIEEVYWRHRIWPAQNPGPKPTLAAVMSDAAIRAKVEDSSRKSNALAQLWNRPVTAAQLQAELDRMARSTRDPTMLAELFAVLDNDPRLIAETLARQTLADRRIRALYADDDRFHGELGQRARELASSLRSAAEMPALGGEYAELTYRRKAADAAEPGSAEEELAVALDAQDWQDWNRRLAGWFGARGPEGIPLRTPSALQEDADRFFVAAVLSQSASATTVATVTWNKRSFEAWWAEQRSWLEPELLPVRGSFALPAPAIGGCTEDTWESRFYAPSTRSAHSAVWTGTEMIVWGGFTGGPSLNTGGRYDPATDLWTPTSVAGGVPTARTAHTAIWSGTEMIVWGGGSSAESNTGGRYDPAVDQWMPTSVTGAVPAARSQHVAVWTGTTMIVWGGLAGSSPLNSGGRYDPAADSWTSTSTGSGVPSARYLHCAVWTGTRMIVWGGWDRVNYLNTGGRYDPVMDTWTPTSVTDATARRSHSAVWSGSEVIVWGGGTQQASTTNTGGRYDPATDTWTPTSSGANVPTARTSHKAVWTGAEMIVWGGSASAGSMNTGGRYDPVTDSWTPTSVADGVPTARSGHSVVWTGTEMIVWGGGPSGGSNTGGRYDPATDGWTATSVGMGVPAPRTYHTTTWTGAEMIVWGGHMPVFPFIYNTGGRYDPATDTWAPTSVATGVPSARRYHSAVWTGTEMIVWGGAGSSSVLPVTGGRYDPQADSWTPTAISPAPEPRVFHTAVWTGDEMIVWGGNDGFSDDWNTGGRYDPVANRWTATSTGAGVPQARYRHTAVWTGAEMIVWGGATNTLVTDGPAVNTGARYDPATDGWTATSMGADVPTPRESHTAVWTGTEMIVWGGFSIQFPHEANTGGRYDPAKDKWSPTSIGSNVPSARSRHTGVWTGSEMIVWGGREASRDGSNTGGRYDPATDGWTPSSTGTDVPPAKVGHGAVWTGTQMVVWGGEPSNTDLGLYCAPGCAIPTTMWRDVDDDGYGDATEPADNWTCAAPAGWSAHAGDCAPADSTAYALPGEVGGLAFDGDRVSFSWNPAGGGSGTLHDVVRGRVDELPVGAGSSESCLTSGITGTTASDSAQPASGEARWYLVRGRNVCGSGTYGHASSGLERLPSVPCP